MIDASLLMGLVVFLLAMGWYPCCCGGETPEECLSCITGTELLTVVVEIGGMEDDDCPCESLINGSHILQQSIGSPCTWITSDSIACYLVTNAVYSVSAFADAGKWDVRLGFVRGFDAYYYSWEWDSGDVDPIDCSEEAECTYVGYSEITANPSWVPCTKDPDPDPTCTVNVT